jgi:uncharacterized protein
VHSRKPTGEGPGLSESIRSRHGGGLTVTVTLVVGTALLASALRAPAGSPTFFVTGFLVAGTWVTGSVIAGAVHMEAIRSSRLANSLGALALGLFSFVGFLAADLLGRHLPLVSHALDTVVTKANAGPAALVLAVALANGLGEELFFRGALFDVLGSRSPVAGSAIIYAAVTATTGNVALFVAACAMGIVFSLERARTGGVLTPILTHLCWSTLMLLALPR